MITSTSIRIRELTQEAKTRWDMGNRFGCYAALREIIALKEQQEETK